MNPDSLIPKPSVIEVAPKPTDWVNGGETGLISAPINPQANWDLAEPPGEWQRDMRTLFETDACVSFSACDVLETYGDYCLKNGLWTPEQMAWLAANGYIDATGHLNFSDRFVAKMSGTTQNGNSLPAVWAAINTYGLVPEAMWPNNFGALQPAPDVSGETPANWALYYAEIPAEVQTFGKAFLQHFKAPYEWVVYPGVAMTPDGFRAQLTYSPLQLATAVCMPWNSSSPIPGCGVGTAHATMMSSVADTYHILDHYDPFMKQFQLDYAIPYAMRGILQPVVAAPTPTPFHHTFNVDLVQGMAAGPEVSCLQTALQTLKSPKTGVSYMKAGVFGPYGPQTAAAVAAFQADHNIPDSPPGHDFGPKTRAAMNAALNS